MTAKRAFLFLQGPPGPFFRELGRALAQRGVAVHRINISGGDYRDWPDANVNFRSRFSEWPSFIDRYLREHGITDMMLFGDCRPYHVSARGIAELRAVRTHVLEEGYLRPDWMTLEPEGVNARSTLSREKQWFLAEARKLPPEPDLPRITASFRRRARDSYWYYHSTFTGRFRFPHYRSHRTTPILAEGFGWLWKFARQSGRERRAKAILSGLPSKAMFVLPLQLSTDYQIRTHSLFPDMQSAATYVMESFAANAPSDVHLLLKSHPLDPSFFNWTRFVRRVASRLQVADRIHFVDGGDLDDMLQNASGMVCVNSTSATLALARGIPVCTIGEAIYDMAGLTHQGHLDTFWTDPTPPEDGVYAAFRRVLVHRSLVRGGLASRSAVDTLIHSVLDRLEIAQQRTTSSAADARTPENRRRKLPNSSASITPAEPAHEAVVLGGRPACQ